jgi:hypothetical protein
MSDDDMRAFKRSSGPCKGHHTDNFEFAPAIKRGRPRGLL